MIIVRRHVPYLALVLLFTGWVPWSHAQPDDWPGPGELIQHHSGFLTVAGGKLFYETAGEGDVLVFLHDGLLHHVTWDEQFSVFAQRFRVVRYDRRGYGRSTQPEQPYSNIEDLSSLFGELGIDQACLLGASAGGQLAIDFTLAHPDRVTALILAGAVVSGLEYTDHFLTRGGHLDPAVRQDPELFIRYLHTTDPYQIAPQNTATRERVEQLLAGNEHNLDPRKFTFLQGPSRPAVGVLHEISVPVLVVVGEHDIPDVHAHAGAIHAGIPTAQRVVVRDAGHLVPMEQPDAFNTLVLDFFREGHFFALLSKDGVAAAVREFDHLRAEDPTLIPFSEARMNGTGYRFLYGGQVAEAIELFKLNVRAYPESWNVYDSLAEAYMQHGDIALAIQYYEKSLAMNPDNDGARERLPHLREQLK